MSTSTSSNHFSENSSEDGNGYGPLSPFLFPEEKTLREVPAVFEDSDQYFSIMANNVLAEFWSFRAQAISSCERQRDIPFKRAAGGRLYIEGGLTKGELESESWRHKLVHIGESTHVVLRSKEDYQKGQYLFIEPPLPAPPTLDLYGHEETGTLKVLGYIGNLIAEYEAARDLHRSPPDTALMKDILHPDIDNGEGDYKAASALGHVGRVPPNASQQAAVLALRRPLETIQGPPGTGKSTTVAHIIMSRLPDGQRAVVACERNKAVDAISEKLAGNVSFVVFGNLERLCETSTFYTLDKQVRRHPHVVHWNNIVDRISATLCTVTEALEEKIRSAPIGSWDEERFRHRRPPQWSWHKVWRRFISHKYADIEALQRRLRALLACGRAILSLVRLAAAKEVLLKARAVLSTIASSSKITNPLKERDGARVVSKLSPAALAVIFGEVDARTSTEFLQSSMMDFWAHTAIIDEAACVMERSVCILLRMNIKNLVLLGDHLQLAPISHCNPEDVKRTNYARSMMERVVIVNRERLKMLTTQYRMHPKLSGLVSREFYNGRVHDAPGLEERRPAEEPLVWFTTQGLRGEEETVRKSFFNGTEAAMVVNLYKEERAGHPKASIMVITFYKAQMHLLRDIFKANEIDDPLLRIVTVDSAQGSEADIVILSTVRSNGGGRIGFASDRSRVLVAISRARHVLRIIGDHSTFGWNPRDGVWIPIKGAFSCRDGGHLYHMTDETRVAMLLNNASPKKTVAAIQMPTRNNYRHGANPRCRGTWSQGGLGSPPPICLSDFSSFPTLS